MHRKHRIPILSSCHTRKKRQLRNNGDNNISHSIPRLSYLSHYSIPVGCSIALLLLGIVCINPTVYSIVDDSNVYAIEEDNASSISSDGSSIDDKDSELGEVDSKEELSSNTNISTLSNDSIATLADTSDSGDNDSSAALIVDDGIIYDTILADAGSPVYKSHTITIKAANLESYVLQVSATNVGTSELVNKDNSSIKVNGVGTSGVLGKNLPSGTWGIGWGDTSVADENLTYYTLPAYGTTASSISTGRLENVSGLDGADVNSTKKLTLAANFSPDTVDGHYTTSLLLSLVVEPVKLVELDFGGYTTFDQVTKSVCETIPIGAEGRLKDARDGKIYWVARIKNSLDDEALCWMTQNLDYDGGENGSNATTLTTGINFTESTQSQKLYYDPGNYVYINGSSTSPCNGATIDTGLSACTNNGWEYINGTLLTSAQIKVDDAEKLHYHAGNYYSWAAATNSNASAAKDTSLETSICPAEWKLQTIGYNEGSSYRLLYNLTNTQVTANPYYFTYSGAVSISTLINVSNYGFYWSSTAYVENRAYNILITGSSVNPSTYSFFRYYGYSVRCVAR